MPSGSRFCGVKVTPLGQTENTLDTASVDGKAAGTVTVGVAIALEYSLSSAAVLASFNSYAANIKTHRVRGRLEEGSYGTHTIVDTVSLYMHPHMIQHIIYFGENLFLQNSVSCILQVVESEKKSR